MSSNILHEKSKPYDYEVVCKSILEKYTNLNETVVNLCKVENSSPSKKTIKRLQPHVILSNYYIL